MYYHLCPCSAAQTHFSPNTVTAQLHTHTLTSPRGRIKWSVFTTDTDIWGTEEDCVCRVGIKMNSASLSVQHSSAFSKPHPSFFPLSLASAPSLFHFKQWKNNMQDFKEETQMIKKIKKFKTEASFPVTNFHVCV